MNLSETYLAPLLVTLSLALVACDSDGSVTGTAGQATEGAGESDSGSGSESDTGGTDMASSSSDGDTDGETTTTSGSTSSGGPLAPECGGTCFAEVVADAFNTCQSDLEDYPCDAPTPCPPARVACDFGGENCSFDDGNGDAQDFVDAVGCVLDAVSNSTPGQYPLVAYSEAPEDPKDNPKGPEFSAFFGYSMQVEPDGAAQVFSAGVVPFEGGFAAQLSDLSLECVRDMLSDNTVPTNFDEAVAALAELSAAQDACSELCLSVFEGDVQFVPGCG